MKKNLTNQLISKAIAIFALTNVFALMGAQVALSDTVVLKGALRDFSDQHPDFERTPGVDGFHYGLDPDITTNAVESVTEIVDGQEYSVNKPIYAGGSYSTTTKANFDQWYRDVDGVNQRFVNENGESWFSIELEDNDGDGIYNYQNTNFFPINDQLMGNEGRNKNFHFTYEIHSKFTYRGGEVFKFSGDDDVWVYINGYKVIDIGGVHSKKDAEVSLDDIAASIGLQVGGTYEFDFFFAERHTTQSNFIIETSIYLKPLSD